MMKEAISKDYALWKLPTGQSFQNSKSGVHIDVTPSMAFPEEFHRKAANADDLVWVMGMPEAPKQKQCLHQDMPAL